MMRIGIDARAFGWTGIGRYVRNVLERVTHVSLEAALPYEFIVFTPKASARTIVTLPRTDIVPVRDSYYSMYEQTVFLLRMLRKRLDLMHFPNFNVPVGYRRPFIVTIHDLTRFHFPGQKHTSRLHQTMYEFVFRSAVHRAQAIIAVSEFTKRELLRFFPRVASKVSVVYEGVDEQFQRAGKPARTRHNFRDVGGSAAGGNSPPDATEDAEVLHRLGVKAPYLLYVGLWMHHKNLPRLISAFRRLRASGYPGALVVTGEGRPWDVDVRALAARAGVGEAVRLPGTVRDADLPALYRHADAFLFLSLSEGFGLPPLEAMACGTPVVAAHAGSLPEVLGDAALFADPLDAEQIARAVWLLLTDSALRARMVERGGERARRFTWNACGRQTLEIYAHVAAGLGMAAGRPASLREALPAGQPESHAHLGNLVHYSRKTDAEDSPNVPRYPHF